MNKTMVFCLLAALSLNAGAQTVEKMVLGRKIVIPSMGSGLVPICEDNKQVVQYLNNTMARPGLSEVITCFFVQGVGNSKLEHAVVILSFNEIGETDVDKGLFLKIKDRVITNTKNNAEKIISESREASIKQGLPVSSNTAAPNIEIKVNQDDYAIFQYDTKVPLKSAGREVEKSNTLAIVRVKNRVLSLNSYAYEIDLDTKNKIFRSIEIWINGLIRINS